MRINQLNAKLHSSSSSSSQVDRSAAAAEPSGSSSADEDHQHHDHAPHEVLSPLRLDTDTAAGGVRLRFRRKSPTFQVIEFYASGAAMEEYKPRSPQELGLHPRDVTLFAPISRLAAPQRATIAVHDGKILVKTEIVKAIITADKAVLIKGRRQRDTQKLSQAILMANDQRLMALRIHEHQEQQLQASTGLFSSSADSSSMLGSCERAASAADLLRMAAAGAAKRGSARVNMQPGSAAAGSGSSSGGLAAAAAGDQVSVLSAASSDLKDVPFEMLVLEVLLDATAEYFYTKVQHLNWMLESIAADLRQPSQPGGAIDRAHQLIPIQKFLTRVKNDVKETCEAIQAALEDDETLQELCLSWHLQQKQHTRWVPVELQRHRAGVGVGDGGLHNGSSSSNGNGNGTANGLLAAAGADAAQAGGPAQQVRMLTEMLESYEREIQSLEGSINEAEEDLENTRSIWHMQLDSSRNHIIMVNLWLSMLNISVMATTILPAFFGMNLGSGLEESDPTVFYAVCGVSLVLAGLSYPLSRFWYTRNWRRISENELFEQKMLRVLLVQNIEDIDEIVRALQQRRHERIDRRAFRLLVMQTLGNRAMPPSQIDFLYQCFDRDRDGFLSEAELIRPLNTFYQISSSNGSSSSSFAPEPSQQQGLAGNLAAGLAGNMLPSQLGSLQGPGMPQPDDQPLGKWADDRVDSRDSRDAAGLDQLQGVFSKHAVRRSPRELQQALKKKQLQKQDETNWEDDERYGWD